MMTDYDFDIGVLGGGAAGLTVTAGAAQLGAKTLLVEKEKALGGDCLHYGCVPSKTLIRTASLYHKMKNAQKYGLPRTDVQSIDYREVANRFQSVISTIQNHDSPERFCKLGARVEFGDAAFTDKHSIKLNGRTYTARTWVIATGSSPNIPPTYPTLGEINKRVAGTFLAGKIFSEKVKKGLRFFFNLKGRACFPDDEKV